MAVALAMGRELAVMSTRRLARRRLQRARHNLVFRSLGHLKTREVGEMLERVVRRIARCLVAGPTS